MFIQKLFSEYATDLYSIGEITSKLEEWGMTNKTRKGGLLSKKQVHNILRNPFYYGEMKHKGKLYPHKYEAIISKQLFRKCEDIRTGRNRNDINYSSKPFLFRGMIKCAHCGFSISSDMKKEKYIYLRCTKHKGNCPGVRLTEGKVLKQLEVVMRNLQFPTNILKSLRETLQENTRSKKEYHEKTIDRLQAEYKKIQSRLDTLLDVRLDGSITKEQFDQKAQSLKQKQYDLNTRLEQHTQADDEFNITVSLLLELTSRAYELFCSSKIDQKRRILNLLFSNLQLEGEKLLFTVNKPFDLLMSMPRSEVWHPQGDSNPCRRRERAVS